MKHEKTDNLKKKINIHLTRLNQLEVLWSYSQSDKVISPAHRLFENQFIKYTTDTDRSASYLDLHLEIDSEGRLRAKLYDKRDDFNFLIVNFPFICSNIPAAPAYGVYISQMIRYSRACGSYQDFLDRGLLLTKKLLVITSKFYGRHHHLVDCYRISVSQMTTDMFHLSQTLPGPFLIHDLLPGL